MLPFVVSAIALVVGVGASYVPVSDHALSEMLVRDVGRHPVLSGLYSRENWSHPGPILYYILAPFYWVTGGSSIGLSLGALAINGGSVVGMGLIARRRAGTAAMAATFLGTALLMRTLGAEFFGDFWNCFITVMPFGLLIFLAWSMLDGDRWALPVGVFVATFLAQTHVGFVILALPLLALGAGGLVLSTRRNDAPDRWRSLVRPGVVSAALGSVLWLPPLVDIANGPPGNLSNAIKYFRTTDEAPRSVSEGLRVMSGQFGIRPEWATKVEPYSFLGESRYIYSPVVPWLLVLVAASAAFVCRRKGTGRSLVLMAAASFGVGVLAVARTVGLAFQYRLLWTYIPAVVGFLIVALAAWELISSRGGPNVRRGAVAIASTALLVLTGVNVVTAATAGVPNPDETAAMRSLSSQVLEFVDDSDGPVLVVDPFSGAAWYARGIVLQLDRNGIDAVVLPENSWEVSEHRVQRKGPVAVELVVVSDEAVTTMLNAPGHTLIAEWSVVSEERIDAYEKGRAGRRAEVEAGRMSEFTAVMVDREQSKRIVTPGGAIAYRVAVFEKTASADK